MSRLTETIEESGSIVIARGWFGRRFGHVCEGEFPLWKVRSSSVGGGSFRRRSAIAGLLLYLLREEEAIGRVCSRDPSTLDCHCRSGCDVGERMVIAGTDGGRVGGSGEGH